MRHDPSCKASLASKAASEYDDLSQLGDPWILSWDTEDTSEKYRVVL